MNRHSRRTRIPYRSSRNILRPPARSTAANPGASAIQIQVGSSGDMGVAGAVA